MKVRSLLARHSRQLQTAQSNVVYCRNDDKKVRKDLQQMVIVLLLRWRVGDRYARMLLVRAMK